MVRDLALPHLLTAFAILICSPFLTVKFIREVEARTIKPASCIYYLAIIHNTIQ